jgi:predicted transcriptional regulator
VGEGQSADTRAVLELLNEAAARPRAYTTVMTAMHRLDHKRLLTRRRLGKADVFSPRVSRQSYAREIARREPDRTPAAPGDPTSLALSDRS